MKISVTVEVEAPDGAIHYGGELLDNPRWWKLYVNSTGLIKVWCFWDGKVWRVQGEHQPPWIKEITGHSPGAQIPVNTPRSKDGN